MNEELKKLVEFRKRYAVLELFTDIEVRQLSMIGPQKPLSKGEQYVDLIHPEKGVQTVASKNVSVTETMIPKSEVTETLWLKLIASSAEVQKRYG